MGKSNMDFFASANSGRGFINLYREIFKGLNKHYIIKGGPGTGKSSLMKAAANFAENKGMCVERFYCSSDPDSLDGIIINELSVGITDGTAPHSADPVYPGVCDEIINLGEFWDGSVLSSSKEYIIQTTNKKSELYRKLYACLAAALSMDEIIQYNLLKATDMDNLFLLARSYAQTIPFRKGHSKVRLTNAISMKGPIKFLPFKNEAEVIYNIKDSYGIAHHFLNFIKEYMHGSDITLSYDAFDTEKINMLYCQRDKLLFCVNGEGDEEIDINEFVSSPTDENERLRQQIDSLMSEGYNTLSRIEKLHFSLEEIYISSMDFSQKEEYQNSLLRKIFT
ncbi:MAG: hypothetical protein IJA55_05925 [Clostridia bacterium]|nr:hypothetical protein [Clostridia bacterium]